MAKAAQGYHKRDLYSDVTARIPGELQTGGAVTALARWHARQAVKKELYAQGIKLAHVEASEISRAANRYIDNHPEIIAKAFESHGRLVASGRLRPPRKLKLCST